MYGGKGNTRIHNLHTYTHTHKQTYIHADTAPDAAALHPSFVRGTEKSRGEGGGLQWAHLTLLKRDDRRIVNADLVVKRAEEVGFRVGTVDWMHLSLQDQVVK
jgi:hypothetical protein